jgi:hypothetical protein
METPALTIEDRDLLSSWAARIATALGGASEAELVDLLCANLFTAGFDLDIVEMSCDTVDAERSNLGKRVSEAGHGAAAIEARARPRRHVLRLSRRRARSLRRTGDEAYPLSRGVRRIPQSRENGNPEPPHLRPSLDARLRAASRA